MKLQVHCKDIDTKNRTTITEHINRILGRFSPLIRRADVRVVDENGPKGGRDSRVVIEALLHEGERLVITERSAEPLAAVRQAAKRIKRAITQRLKRAIARRHAHAQPVFT